MSRDPQRLQNYLKHILLAIKRIQEYCSDIDELGFLRSQLIQDAVILNFEVIGEASKNIERSFPEYAAAHPEYGKTYRAAHPPTDERRARSRARYAAHRAELLADARKRYERKRGGNVRAYRPRRPVLKVLG